MVLGRYHCFLFGHLDPQGKGRACACFRRLSPFFPSSWKADNLCSRVLRASQPSKCRSRWMILAEFRLTDHIAV